MSTSIISATNPHKGTTTSSPFAYSLDAVIQATITNPAGGLLTPCQVTLQLSSDGGATYCSIDSKRGGMGDGTPLILFFRLADYANRAVWTHARLVFSGNTAQSQLGVTVSAAGDGATWSSGGGGGSGTVTSIVAGAGLTGGTITTTGTIALAPIAPFSLMGNSNSLSGAAGAIGLGAGLSFSGSNLVASGGAAAWLTSTAVKTASYTAAPGDFVPVDTTSNDVTVTLPTAPADGSTIAVKILNTGGGNLFVVTGGSDIFNAAGTSLTYSLTGECQLFLYRATGARWYAVADSTPVAQMDTRYLNASNINAGTLAAARLPTTGLNITQHYGSIGVGTIVSTTATLDLSTYDWYILTLNIATTTIALSNPTVGQQFTIRLLQDGTGSRLVNWFTTIKWPGGSAPTLTTTAGKADTFTFKCMSPGQYDGYIAGQNL